jgi:hypothetical protein
VLASAVVVVLGLLLSITGFLLLMALEYMPDLPSRYVRRRVQARQHCLTGCAWVACPQLLSWQICAGQDAL